MPTIQTSQTSYTAGSSNSTVTNARVTGGGERRRHEASERVSLAPLDPEDALRALLATPPLDDDDQE